MINLAGDKNCDVHIKKELEEARIEYKEFSFAMKGEVPSKIIATGYGWMFTRAWCYWIAKAGAGTILLFDLADELHEKAGNDVRVAGHCGCPSPREWYNKPWHNGVSVYHIDTQEGLNLLIKYLSTGRQE